MDMKLCEKVINRLALRVLRRLQAASSRALLISLEDLKQEMWIGACIAEKKFDAERGVPFAAYLQRGLMLHINRYIEEQHERCPAYSYALSLDQGMPGEGDDGAEMTLSNSVPSDEEITEDRIIRISHVMKLREKLSTEARIVVDLLVTQPEEILEDLSKQRFKAEMAQKIGVPYARTNKISMQLIFELMGIDRSKRAKILNEITKVSARIAA